MSQKKWHKGPPPSVGWWPASMWRDAACLRWWDGHNWGKACYALQDKNVAANKAHMREKIIGEFAIEWQNRPKSWPKRSRT